MKKILLLLLASAPCFSASIAGYPDIPVENPVGYATGAVSYTPGPGVKPPYSNTDYALGEPNNQATSLGRGGDLVLSMNPLALTGDKTADPDFYIYEYKVYNSFDVYISNDNSSWIKLIEAFSTGTVKGYDIDSVEAGPYNHIKIIDTSNEAGNSSAGADIDGLILAHGKESGTSTLFDSDSDKGTTFNLEQNYNDKLVDVKIIDLSDAVRYINISKAIDLTPISISVQSDYNDDGQNDINVLVKNNSTGHYLNIIKDIKGEDIKTIDNSLIK